jgi:Ca2+-transporting ATPase
MDAYLHRRTQATTEGLAGRLATQARVLRDGVAREIPSAGLVPGDLVIVNESESFPADGVLVAGVNLQADESALTGEAMPVRKRPFKGASGESETSLDNEYWGAAGTRLLTGEARLRVAFTGGETLYVRNRTLCSRGAA